jgi:hypothetical protein
MKIENMSLTKSYVFFCYLKHGCIMYKWCRPKYSKT